MKKILLTGLATFFCSLAIFAQVPPHRTCGTMEYHEFLKQTRKNYEADFIQYNQMLDQYMASNQFAAKTNVNITIPVVIHVVYNTAAQNISDAQAISQFSVLDNDFNHLNADTVNIPVPFRAVAGKSGIRFCLAQRDPNGNATTGIVHKSTTTTSFTTDNKVKSSATGGDDPWDVTKYMNIWVCNLGSSLLGYGEFPTGTISNTYGLVINYTATGTMGTATAPFNKGRTGTHEFGHCFNLNHIWGDNGQCGNTDNCTDTPPQKGGTAAPAGCNYGTPTYPWQPNTCTRPDGVGGANVTNTNGDMFMNFMDYTDDAAMNMFTKEQCLRMVAVVNTAPWNILQSSLGCTPVTALDASISNVLVPVNGTSSCNTSVTPKITLKNAGSTTLTSATILYKMDALATQTLSWSGSLASTASTVITLNNYSGLSAAAHTFSVWVTAPNAGTDQNAANNSSTSTFTVVTPPAGAALPFTENFEAAAFPPTNWVLQKANTIDPATTWTRVSNTTGLTAGSTAVARMDNYSSNSNITGQLDALRSPALTFTAANTSLNLTFDVSHRPYATSTYIDTLNVYISTDCGGSWTRLYTKGGAQLSTAVGTQTTAYTPTVNTQWRKETVSLSSYAGLSSVYVKFESRSGYGNNLYLDNINITYTTSAGAPVAGFSTTATKCAGSSITFSDASSNTPTSWNWSFPGGTPATSTVQNPTVTYTAAGTYTITHTAANATGTSTPVSQTITVNANPVVTVSNATVCSGTAASLTASGASTYNWNTGATTASISVSPTLTTNYTVTGTSAAGCTNTQTTTVNVNSIPAVAVNGATVCSGTPANLTASGATGYSWNTGATTASISVTPTATTNYTVTGTTAGCSNTKTVSVTVNALPTVAVSNTTICSGTTANLTASGASAYSWNTGATTASIAVTPTITTNYTVTGTTSGCSDTKTLSVTVNTVPAVVVSNTTICSGTTANLTASGATAYSWNTGATTASVAVTPTTTTNYTVTGTTAGCSNTKTLTVTVNSIPVVAVSNATICNGSSANLTASGAAAYSWNTGATTASVSVTPTTTTNYTVTGTTTGCSNTKTVSVTVNTPPTVAASNATICSGTAANLTASGATTYSWNTGATTSSISVSPTTATNYTVTGTTLGCSNTKVVSVAVNASPTVAVTGGTICTGSSANLTAAGAATYIWNTGATTASVSVAPATTTNYTVTGTTSGCSNTKTVSVIVNSLPNVASTSATICAGATTTIIASGAATYTWNTGATGANLTASPSSNTTYTVAGTSSAGCVNTATAMISVGAAPSISVNSSTICAGATATLAASGVNTYTWNTSSNASSISVNPAGTTVYTVTGNLAGCAVPASQTATVTVNSLPVVTMGTVSGPLCTSNAAVTLSGSPSGGTFTGPGVVSSNFDPSVSGAGTFTVMYDYTDANGCSAMDSQAISVSLCTGLTENANLSVGVYPNPAKEVVQVTMSASLVNQATIQLYDAIGKLVISEKVTNTSTTLSLVDYASGMYTIRVVSEDHQTIIKLIKE